MAPPCSGGRFGPRLATRHTSPTRLSGEAIPVDPRAPTEAVPDPQSSVAIVDDDPELRASLARLLRSVGLHTRLFASVAEYLGSEPPDCPTCLVLDVRLPGQSGLDFQRDLVAAHAELQIIFITGHGDIPMS